jgi:peptidoglycan/LPS O-acetylase OafA/YrhL
VSARSPSKVSSLEQGRLTALDGIRAFAVLAVIAFHAGVPGVGGGLLGVDIFFVLSGYLITSILRREFADRHAIALGAFWIRRARRLLPALFILLLGVAAYAHFYAATLNLASIRADAASTLLYVANWHFIFSSQGYFAQSAAPSPLLHTWSLGVEEQYYLIWPLAAVFVMRRFGPRGLAWTAGVGALASATAMGVLYAEGFSIDRLYYGTDTRAQALLVGSFLGAVGVGRRWQVLPERWSASTAGRRIGWALGLLGAAYLVWACHIFGGQEAFLYQGGFLLVALATGAVIVAVVTWPGSLLARVLSLSALTYVGRISYGLYLYHWPLFLVVDHHHTGLSGASLLAVRLALTFAVATASFFVVEEPIRTGRLVRHWRAAAGTAVAVAVTAGAVVLATVAPVGAVPPAVARTIPPAERDQLVAAQAFTTDPVRFAMFGDSISDTLGVGLRVRSKQHYGIREYLDSKIGCDLDANLKVFMGGIVGPAVPGCPDWRRTWKQDIDAARPEVAGLLVGRWEVADHYYDGHWTHVGQRLWDDHLLNELNTAVDILSSDGARVIVFTTPFVDPSNEEPNGTPFSENQPSRVLAYNRLVRTLATERPGLVTVIDLNKLVDPQGHFTTDVDGLDVRWTDGIHITLAGGEWLQQFILPTIDHLAIAAEEAHPSLETDQPGRPGRSADVALARPPR